MADTINSAEKNSYGHWSTADLALKAMTKERDAALLQIRELQEQVARFTMMLPHDGKPCYGPGCEHCDEDEEKKPLEKPKCEHDWMDGGEDETAGAVDICKKCGISFHQVHTEKRKDEGCESCGNPSKACEEHGKPIGISKASGPGFCGECLGVLPCQTHCPHDWSASAGQVCVKCGQFRVRR